MHADFAVGAPFDDGGKVFIYHGSNSTSIINATVQQVYTQTLACCMHACMIYNQSFVHFRWSQLSRLCHRSQSWPPLQDLVLVWMGRLMLMTMVTEVTCMHQCKYFMLTLALRTYTTFLYSYFSRFGCQCC